VVSIYVNHRWLGGTLTNIETIRKSVARWDYIEDIDKKPEFKAIGKKELAAMNREKQQARAQPQGRSRHGQAILTPS